MIVTSCKVDMTGLNRGLSLASQFTKRTPTEAVHFAAKEVAFAAYANTTVTTPARVDAELNVIKVPVIGKRGKEIKKKRFASKAGTATGNNSGVPLAVLIVQARVTSPRAGSFGTSISRYNQLTGFRYAIGASPFAGVSRAAGQAAMAAMIDIMAKGRHRSANGFIRAGWIPDMRQYAALCPAKYGGARRPPTMTNPELGGGTPAQPGSTNAVCTIENRVGMDGKNGLSHNQGMLRVGTPALQAALDGEGRKQMQYFLSKVGKEDLEIPVNKAWA